MRILVTGASGFIGSKIAECAGTTHEVYSGYNHHKPAYGAPVNLDLTELAQVDEVFHRVDPDIVIHSAAIADVDFCEREPKLAESVNALGTGNVAVTARNHKVPVIYISTDYVFDGEKGDYHETDDTNPINTYGRTKLKGENNVTESGVDYLIVRTSAVYGAPYTLKMNYAHWVITNLNEKKPVSAPNDQFITPTLNTNLAEMTIEVAERQLTGILHLSGSSKLDRNTFARLVAREFSLDENLVQPTTMDQMNWVARRPRDSTLNTEKAAGTLKHKPLGATESLRRLHSETLKR
jgi:dTDP-4-dehydrorhamnose reductase